jgi:hypothetical protein
MIKISYKLYATIERLLGVYTPYSDLEVQPGYFMRVLKLGPLTLAPGYDEYVKEIRAGL